MDRKMDDNRQYRREIQGSAEEEGRKHLDQIARWRSEENKVSREKYLADSRERLRKNIESKIRTTMIGCLSNIEQIFGFLWGQGKPQQALTSKELEMLELKEKLRTIILNLGNNQLRAATTEIGQYEVEWKRYQYVSRAGDSEPNPIFGLNENGVPRKLRYGKNADGSIKTSPEG